MKKLFARFAPGVLALAIAAGCGIAATTIAFAQTPPAPAVAPMPPHPPMGPGMQGGAGMHGGQGMRGGNMMMEVERLKTSLKLNAGQTALWDKAQEQMKPPTDMRETMKTRHERMAAMLDDPGFDPRKLAAEMDSMQSEQHAKMTAVRDAWFAVYDSLNPVQRGQAREFLRSHMSHGHGMRGHGGWMHGHDGAGSRGPMQH